MFGVEGKHLAVGQFFRIEAALPLLVGVAGSADTKLTWSGNGEPPLVRFNHGEGAEKRQTSITTGWKPLWSAAAPLPLSRSQPTLPSHCLAFRFRRESFAHEFNGVFEPLALFPEIGPEIPFFFQACRDCFYVQRFGLQGGAQFAWQDWRGDRCLGERAHRIRRGEWLSVSVLLDVDQDAAGRAFCDDAF